MGDADWLRVPLVEMVEVADCEVVAVMLCDMVGQLLGEAVGDEDTDSEEQVLGEAD